MIALSQVLLPTQLDSPPKRMRLNHKSDNRLFPACSGFVPQPVKDDEEQETEEAGREEKKIVENEQWWSSKDEKQRYCIVYNRLKRHYAAFKNSYERANKKSVSWPTVWTKLTPAFRERLISHYLEQKKDTALPCLLDWIERTQCKMGGHKEKRTVQNPKQSLLTYNCDKFLVPSDPDLVLPESVDKAVTLLSTLPFVISLWEEIQARVATIVESCRAIHYACSMELSTSTLNKDDQDVRLHVHLALFSHHALAYKTMDDLQICDAIPVPALKIGGRSLRTRTDYCALYYASCPKFGGIFKIMSLKPHVDYAVAATWIWHWASLKKLTTKVARQEFILQGKDLTKHLPNLDRLERELETQRINLAISARDSELATVKKPWKPNPFVDQWMATYSLVEGRRKFLVLSGGSRAGKSDYACGLVGADCALRLNCMSILYPPLREFDQADHKLICFDEASVEFVLKNKYLFQCPNSLVQVGVSPTCKDVYHVYLHFTFLVVTSNTWQIQMEVLKNKCFEDWDWIEKNSWHYKVSGKLYEDDASAPSTPTPSAESP